MTVPPETNTDFHDPDVDAWGYEYLREELLTIEGSIPAAERLIEKNGREEATAKVLTYWGVL